MIYELRDCICLTTHTTILHLVFGQHNTSPGDEPIQKVFVSFLSSTLQEANCRFFVCIFWAVSKQRFEDFKCSIVSTLDFCKRIFIKILARLGIVSAVIVYMALKNTLSLLRVEENDFCLERSVLLGPSF